jgi:hypothetical protein
VGAKFFAFSAELDERVIIFQSLALVAISKSSDPIDELGLGRIEGQTALRTDGITVRDAPISDKFSFSEL